MVRPHCGLQSEGHRKVPFFFAGPPPRPRVSAALTFDITAAGTGPKHSHEVDPLVQILHGIDHF